MKLQRIFLSVLLLVVSAARAEFFGGVAPEMQGCHWRLSAGGILGLSGSVDETFRAYYKASGQNSKQSLAESYDLDDFGVSTPYPVLGLHYESQWPYYAFRWNTMFFNMDASARAKRDYYIGIGDDIKYHGRKYDHLKIPKGSDFSVEIAGAMTDLTFGFTPVTFLYGDGDIKFTPSLDVGLVLILAQYDIDAGTPRGTAVYQNPPVDFVVGGESKSLVGAGAPMIGASGELRVGPANQRQWISRLGVGYFAYDGSSTPFTSESHREKNLDVSFLSITAETGFRYPFENGNALTLGIRLQILDIDGEVTSKEKDTAAIIAARERFDKKADFTMVTTMLTLGYSF